MMPIQLGMRATAYLMPKAVASPNVLANTFGGATALPQILLQDPSQTILHHCNFISAFTLL